MVAVSRHPGCFCYHHSSGYGARAKEVDYSRCILALNISSSNKLARYSVLQAVSENGLYKSVAVPSRLYASPSKEEPLAGVRLNLKDNINLVGIHTILMNRAYADLYPPATKSTAYAEKLAALGAVIVGKTKLCAFASTQEPTDQWIDYHCPFNPRGDFYQPPSGSTTGGGASLAGYPWLDYSIGTDSMPRSLIRLDSRINEADDL
jgi:Asp-tRNA(Asn)/Glu-tRNA(Gln) amidotransferase A subunit family amidase